MRYIFESFLVLMGRRKRSSPANSTFLSPRLLFLSLTFILGSFVLTWFLFNEQNEQTDPFLSHSPAELRRMIQSIDEKKNNGGLLLHERETLRNIYKAIHSRGLSSWWTTYDFQNIAECIDDADLQYKSAIYLLHESENSLKGLYLAKKLINATNIVPHPLRPKLLDSTASYYIRQKNHENAIEILQSALAERTNNKRANRWYGFLLQELIHCERLEEAKEIAIHCLEELKGTNPADFPYFCYQQYGSLLTFEGTFSEAFYYYQELYTFGMQQWRDERGKKCAESSFVPISLLPIDQLDPNLIESENIIPKHMRGIKKCSNQTHPFIMKDGLVTNDLSQEMKCITQNDKAAFLYHLQEVTVLGPNKWIIQSGPNGRNCHLYTFSFPYGNTRSIPRYFGSHTSPWHTIPLKVIPKALIIHFADYNYYHLTIEAISQVMLAIQNPLFQNDDFVILFSDSSPAAYELIKLLGFGSHVEWYDWRSYRYHIIDAYVVDWKYTGTDNAAALDPQEYYVPPSNVIRLLRSFMKPYLPLPRVNKERNQVILFNRNEKQERSISNEEFHESIREIAISNGYGFTVHTGNGDLQAQIELLSRAVAVLGVHGAGLTNMIYCKSGTAVLEIPVYPFKTSVYSRLASSLNLPYWTLPDSEIFHYGFNKNITILPIQQTLNAMLQLQKTKLGL